MSSETEKKLLKHAHRLGVKITQPIHESYRLDLPEGMTLEHFANCMAVLLLSPVGATEVGHLKPQLDVQEAHDTFQAKRAGHLRYEPTSAPHPGELVREHLEANNWTITRLAFAIGLPVETINALLDGRHDVDATLARSLESAFERPARLWLELQRQHDELKAKAARRGP